MKRQGCRRKKSPQKTSSQGPKNSQVNGDTLRSAVMWIVNGLSCDHVKLDVSDRSRSSVGFSPRFPEIHASAWAKAHPTTSFVGDVKLHGHTKWLPCNLIILAVSWVWSDQTTLTAAFQHAHKLSMAMLGMVQTWVVADVSGKALAQWHLL